ncbi:hypothetical protein SFC43_18885 [Bacteroides sp. CR5/BHMF/2]|nr:hypothetical protein [Bacteroides sp. CR5/BHMF/2]
MAELQFEWGNSRCLLWHAKACRPLHIQMSLNHHKVDIINTTLKEYRNLKVEVVVYDKVGKRYAPHNRR